MNLLKEANVEEVRRFIDSVLGGVDEIQINEMTLQNVTNVKIRNFSEAGIGNCVTFCFSFRDAGNAILEFNPMNEKLAVYTTANEGGGIDLVFELIK